MGSAGTALAKEKGKFGATPISAPRTDAERKAVETYIQLRAARNLREGSELAHR